MLVLDASLVIAACFEEDHTTFAQEIVETHLASDMFAPALLPWEFANVLWKKCRRSEISQGQAAESGGYLDSLRLIYAAGTSGRQVSELAGLALRSGLTAYDAAYLSLALELSVPLATTDRELARAAVRHGLAVHSPFA